MNLVEVLRIWRRRWILTALALLVALAVCGVAAMKLPRSYQASCTVVLVPSQKASHVLGEGNPYLSFTDSLSTAADITATELMAPATQQDLVAKGFSEPYTAVAESTTSQTAASGSVLPGPFVMITVIGSNQESVRRTLSGVTSQIHITVRAMQLSISRNNRIALSILSYTPQATLNVSTMARSLVFIMGLLVVIALSVPLMVDAQITRRRMRGDIVPRRIRTQQPATTLPQEAGGHPM